MWSDNGSNFVGADRELRNAVQQLESFEMHNAMLKRSIVWNFNPPAASHQGGVWERVIRSVRKVLYSLVADCVLNDESLHTFIVKVERILNNRPITSLSDDPRDCEPLSPKTLLCGAVDADEPLGVFVKADGYRKSRKLVQNLADQFWFRWRRMYVPILQSRQKWLKPRRNLVVGDLVLIADESKRGNWPKAIVQEVFPDKEGLVRRVRVGTAGSSMTRDVRKLCLIERSQCF